MGPKEIQKKSQKIWFIRKLFYTFAKEPKTIKPMTNKECKIKNLRQSWGELLLEKERLITEVWDIEYKLNLIKETLLRYGISQTNSELGKNKTDMGENDHLDNCFAHDGNTPVHKL